MTTSPFSDGLLGFADDVLRASEPSPAALRRAVSAAYYAVFHQLIRVAVRQILGTDPAHEPDWQIASRWYSHHDVKVVSGWITGGPNAQKLPKSIETLLGSPPPELREFAKIVSDLQDERVVADYAPSGDPVAEDVRDLVSQARRALVLLDALPGRRVGDNYLMLLLGGPRLPLRRAG